jgi:hypothetical protein
MRRFTRLTNAHKPIAFERDRLENHCHAIDERAGFIATSRTSVGAGDSDFVPAFKFVRREGVKVIVDPSGHNVRTELREQADIVIA